MNKNMIAKRLQIIEDLMTELNVIKDMYDSALENDPIYQEVQETESKAKSEVKQKRGKLCLILNTSVAEQMKRKEHSSKRQKKLCLKTHARFL